MSDQFDVMMKTASETASISEVEEALNIRFKFQSKLTSKVKPNDLRVDYSYQRLPSPDRVNSIARNYNGNALGVITLSIRENGELFIIDGQHRIEALKKIGKGNDDINAIVFFDLSIKDEAEMFVIMNESRTKPKRADLHKASAKAGDGESIEIDNVLAKHGLSVGDKPGDNIVRAIGTLHKVNSKIGIDKLDEIIQILIDANGKHSSAFQSEYICAVACILVQFNNVDKTRFTSAIQTLGDPTLAILKAANNGGTAKPIVKILNLAALMLDKYNYRLTKHRLDKYKILSLDARNYLDVK